MPTADLVATLPNSYLSNLKTRLVAVEVGLAGQTAPAWSSVTGKPTFAAVALSGAYGDLSGRPVIPAAQIQSDWNQSSAAALDFIKNKPSIPTGFIATVASGNAVFHLTADGTAGGAALFANGPDLKTMQLTAEEGTNPHSFGVPALSNGNKTLTVPVSKVAPVLGVLNVGQPANGSNIRLLIRGL